MPNAHQWYPVWTRRSIAEGNLRGIIECIKKKNAMSGRLRLFGKLCGVLEADKYNPRMGDVVLHL